MKFARKKIHFIGIGGAGMSAAALVLAQQGACVSGSDLRPSAVFQTLEAAGVSVSDTQDGRRLPPDAEWVVVSLAIPDDNPELLLARRRGQAVVQYSKLLAMLLAEKRAICVAGAHGKTTTAAMTAAVFRAAGRDPSFIIGGEADALGGRAADGSGDVFVAEACEFGRSFLDLRPDVAVVLNIDREHMDTYETLADVQEAFRAFARRALPEGRVVVGSDCEFAAELADELGPQATTFGLAEGATCRGRVLSAELGVTRLEVARDGAALGTVALAVPGKHNVLNALAAIETALVHGLPFDAIQNALSHFTGVRRRLETVGRCNGALVLDDYAHHPTEIRASLAAIRSIHPGGRVWCVFQPHQYRRTRLLFDDFARCFDLADEVTIAPIYAARDTEEDMASVTEEELAEAIRSAGVSARALSGFERIVGVLAKNVSESDIVVTMGAGNVWKIARGLTRQET